MTGPSRVAVLGAGSWGMALAAVAARAGSGVSLWVRDPGLADEIARSRRNPRRLPELELPADIAVVSRLDTALADADMAIFAAPSTAMRAVAEAAAAWIGHAVPLSAAKGLERGTLLRMTEVLRASLPAAAGDRAGALSGPNLAREIAAGLPAATVIASADPDAAASRPARSAAPGFGPIPKTT